MPDNKSICEQNESHYCSNCDTSISVITENEAITSLQQQLSAVNQQIAEANYERERLTACVANLESQLASNRTALEAAEAKLLAARDAMRISHVLLDSKSRNAARIEELLRTVIDPS